MLEQVAEMAGDDRQLEDFHAGRREALEACYREYFEVVRRSAATVLSVVDQESVVQDVFLKVLSSEDFRRNFRGGSMASWLATVARNQAIDQLRVQRRTARLAEEAADDFVPERSPEPDGDAPDARALVERFRREQVPQKWAGVFELRFLRELSQREAAQQLGISRTTLAYQEARLRLRLKDFLLNSEVR